MHWSKKLAGNTLQKTNSKGLKMWLLIFAIIVLGFYGLLKK